MKPSKFMDAKPFEYLSVTKTVLYMLYDDIWYASQIRQIRLWSFFLFMLGPPDYFDSNQI